MRARLLVSAALCCICLLLNSERAAAAPQGCSVSTAAASTASQGGLTASIPKDLVLSIAAVKSADGGRCAASATPESAQCGLKCVTTHYPNLICVTCCSCCVFDIGDPICECSSDCTTVF